MTYISTCSHKARLFHSSSPSKLLHIFTGSTLATVLSLAIFTLPAPSATTSDSWTDLCTMHWSPGARFSRCWLLLWQEKANKNSVFLFVSLFPEVRQPSAFHITFRIYCSCFGLITAFLSSECCPRLWLVLAEWTVCSPFFNAKIRERNIEGSTRGRGAFAESESLVPLSLSSPLAFPESPSLRRRPILSRFFCRVQRSKKNTSKQRTVSETKHMTVNSGLL